MVDQGYSAEEIEKVLRAGPPELGPPKRTRAWKRFVRSHCSEC